MKLTDGSNTHYGLGLNIRELDGQVFYEHSGEVSGFTSDNMVFPQAKLAIAVLTNQDAARAAAVIAHGGSVAGGDEDAGAEGCEGPGQRAVREFSAGEDRPQLVYALVQCVFRRTGAAGFQSSLAPLGKPGSVTQVAEQLRGGMTFRVFRVEFRNSQRPLTISTYTMPDGKLEQYLVVPSS